MTEGPRPEWVSESELPLQFGRYQLLDLLGEGGAARVFRAELQGPAGFRKHVALKILKGGVQSAKIDLVAEAHLGGLLRHRNIVDVYELGQEDDHFFISMELIHGRTLKQVLRAFGPLPASVLMEAALQIAAGLVAAHELRIHGEPAGLVHMDLKPPNVLVGVDGAVKISDFGIARLGGEPLRTAEGKQLISGTPGYMAPEQVRGARIDARADIFAFAILLYEMAAVERLFGGPNPIARVAKVLEIEARLDSGEVQTPLNALVPGLGELARRCLRFEADLRPNSMREVEEVLERLAAEAPRRPRLVRWFERAMAVEALGGTFVQSEAVTAADGVLSDGVGSGTLRLAADEDEATTPFASATVGFEEPVTNLAVAMDAFVGRSAEVDALVSAWMDGERLITLKGSGGMGKTRLARHAAWQVRQRFRGGIWFIDLTGAEDDASFLRATANVLDVVLKGDDADTWRVQLGHAIRARGKTLFVFDNVDRAIRPAVQGVECWGAMASEVSFLVTSRERLRAQAEQVIELAGVRVADGVALFRARTSKGPATTDHGTDEGVAALVEALDGNPLAIELAAARASMLSVETMLARLDERLRLLVGGRRGAAERQNALRATIDWSWEVLSPWEQAALTQLSVFRGGFFMASAEAVLDLSPWPDAPWALDVVASLWDKSLLASTPAEGQPRFSMLESIRVYGQEKLAHPGAIDDSDADLTGADAALRAGLAHASHFAELGREDRLDQLWTRHGQDDRRRLKVELDNLVAAVEFSATCGRLDLAAPACRAASTVLEQRGPMSEARRLLNRVLALEGWGDRPGDQRRRVRLLKALGLVAHVAGDEASALRSLGQALELAVALGDRKGEAGVRRGLGMVLRTGGARNEAEVHYNAALALHREEGDLGGEAWSHVSLGNLAFVRGNTQEAVRHFTEAVEVFRALGNEFEQSRVLSNLARVHREASEFEMARRYGEEELRISRKYGSRLGEASACMSLGNLALATGALDDAERRHRRASLLFQEQGNRWGEAVSCTNLAAVAAERGQVEIAEALLVEGLEIHVEIGNRVSQAKGLGNLANIYFNSQRPEKAEATYKESLQLLSEVGRGYDRAPVLGNLGCFYLSSGRYEEARVALVEAIELSDSAGYTAAKGAFIGALAEVDAMQGDVSGALARLERGENTMRAAGDRVELSKYLARWAWVLARAEERERAERHLAEASQLVREAGVSSVSEAGQLVGRARQVLA